MSEMRYSKRKLHFLFLSFDVGEIETEKEKQTKWNRPKKPIKIVFFGGGHPENVNICKNGCLAKIA